MITIPGSVLLMRSKTSRFKPSKTFLTGIDRKYFFSRQLEIIHEDQYYHWITNRALRKLAARRIIGQEKVKLAHGPELTLYWHKTFRYPKREIKSTVNLVNEYSNPTLSAAIGNQGEALVLEGFARNEFILKARNTNSHNGLQWNESAHDIDFIFEKSGVKYGVEVKNTLGYMDSNEFQTKIALCKSIEVRPVFATRMLPKSWIIQLNAEGGFALILKYQLYPWGFRELAKTVNSKLQLPVDSPNSLHEGTMKRLMDWHKKHVNSGTKSH